MANSEQTDSPAGSEKASPGGNAIRRPPRPAAIRHSLFAIRHSLLDLLGRQKEAL
jgi:hypothetical protein